MLVSQARGQRKQIFVGAAGKKNGYIGAVEGFPFSIILCERIPSEISLRSWTSVDLYDCPTVSILLDLVNISAMYSGTCLLKIISVEFISNNQLPCLVVRVNAQLTSQ